MLMKVHGDVVVVRVAVSFLLVSSLFLYDNRDMVERY